MDFPAGFFLAFFGIFFYNQIYSWLYLLVEAALIYLILRSSAAAAVTNAKLAQAALEDSGEFFRKGHLKKESVGNRLGIVAFVYVLLILVPTAVLFFSLKGFFSMLKLLALICLLTVAVYGLTTWHNSSTMKR